MATSARRESGAAAETEQGTAAIEADRLRGTNAAQWDLTPTGAFFVLGYLSAIPEVQGHLARAMEMARGVRREMGLTRAPFPADSPECLAAQCGETLGRVDHNERVFEDLARACVNCQRAHDERLVAEAVLLFDLSIKGVAPDVAMVFPPRLLADVPPHPSLMILDEMDPDEVSALGRKLFSPAVFHEVFGAVVDGKGASV